MLFAFAGVGTVAAYSGSGGGGGGPLGDAILPTALDLVDTDDEVEYQRTGGVWYSEWTLRMSHLHLGLGSRIDDRQYRFVLVLPVPARDERPRFWPLEWGIRPWGGTHSGGEDYVPMVYAGERVLFKRNLALEATLLPSLTGGEPGQLPALDGTDYAYTLWEAVVVGEPQAELPQYCWATLRYAAGLFAGPPDTSDERLRAYLITWIPSDRDPTPRALRMGLRHVE